MKHRQKKTSILVGDLCVTFQNTGLITVIEEYVNMLFSERKAQVETEFVQIRFVSENIMKIPVSEIHGMWTIW